MIFIKLNFISTLIYEEILFIGGSLNQSTIVHQVGMHLEKDFDCYYSPYYDDGAIGYLAKKNLLNFTVLNPNSNFFSSNNKLFRK